MTIKIITRIAAARSRSCSRDSLDLVGAGGRAGGDGECRWGPRAGRCLARRFAAHLMPLA